MTIAEMVKLGVKGFKPADIRSIQESGIDVKEIISLAENGYSAADVNQLIELAGTGEQVQPGNDAKTDPSGPEESAGNEGDKSRDDYKNEIAEKDSEIEKLKKALNAAQKQNSTKNLGDPDPIDNRTTLQNIFKGIY